MTTIMVESGGLNTLTAGCYRAATAGAVRVWCRAQAQVLVTSERMEVSATELEEQNQIMAQA